MEDYNVGDNYYDFTSVEGDDLLKLFKKTGDNDLVYVTKSDDGNYEVKDDETGAEYVIELNPNSQEDEVDDLDVEDTEELPDEDDEEATIDLELDDDLSDNDEEASIDLELDDDLSDDEDEDIQIELDGNSEDEDEDDSALRHIEDLYIDLEMQLDGCQGCCNKTRLFLCRLCRHFDSFWCIFLLRCNPKRPFL